MTLELIFIDSRQKDMNKGICTQLKIGKIIYMEKEKGVFEIKCHLT